MQIIVRTAAILALLAVPLPLHGALTERSVVLARGCVAEISIQPTGRECRIMWHILLDKVDGELDRIVGLMRRYNTLFKRAAVRPWVLRLDDSGDAPLGWPVSWRWTGRHDRWWATMLQDARDFEQKPGRHPCPHANHYGGTPGDKLHADDPVPSCWRRIDCGQTAQAYWRRPNGGCRGTLPASVASGARMSPVQRGRRGRPK